MDAALLVLRKGLDAALAFERDYGRTGKVEAFLKASSISDCISSVMQDLDRGLRLLSEAAPGLPNTEHGQAAAALFCEIQGAQSEADRINRDLMQQMDAVCDATLTGNDKKTYDLLHGLLPALQRHGLVDTNRPAEELASLRKKHGTLLAADQDHEAKYLYQIVSRSLVTSRRFEGSSSFSAVTIILHDM